MRGHGGPSPFDWNADLDQQTLAPNVKLSQQSSSSELMLASEPIRITSATFGRRDYIGKSCATFDLPILHRTVKIFVGIILIDQW